MLQRIDYIDALRTLACFLVILTHSAMPTENANDGIYMFFYSFISSPATQIFFAISGALLFPVKRPMKEFYKRRFIKILPPVLIWSIISILIYMLLGNITIEEGLKRLVLMPIRPAISIYWFIYVMIGLYLIGPIISKWLVSATKREIEFFLFLWGINLCMPFLNLIIPNVFSDSGSHYWMLNYFGGYLGYWILGYYLSIYPFYTGCNKKFIWLCTFLIGYIVLILILKLHNIDDQQYTYYLQIGNALMVIWIFTVTKDLSPIFLKLQKPITEIAKYSFGIYLVHILIVRELVWRLFENHHIFVLIKTPLIAITSLILSYILLKILTKLPYSKYIIGI